MIGCCLLGIFIFIFYFLVRKIQVIGIRTHVPTCQKVTRLPTELHTAPCIPGRPACSSTLYVLFICTNTDSVFKFSFYSYWYSYIVYFVCDSASELERWALLPFLFFFCPNLLLVFLNLLFLGTCYIFFRKCWDFLHGNSFLCLEE